MQSLASRAVFVSLREGRAKPRNRLPAAVLSWVVMWSDQPKLPGQPEIRHSYVQANGVRFHVARTGKGPTLLLLHGYPEHWYAWRRVIPLLSESFSLVALDLRGSGWSGAPRQGYDTRTRAADVLAVMDALQLQRVGLIGHEWGGWLGFRLCLDVPERFGGLLAVNSMHPWLSRRRIAPHIWRFWYTVLLEFPWLGGRAVRQHPNLLRWLLRRGGAQDLDSFVDAACRPDNARAGQKLHWQFAMHDIPRLVLGRSRDERLQVPAIIVAGTDDVVLRPQSLVGVEPYGKELRLVILPGGHYLPEQCPAELAELAAELFEALG
jgi:pimeloyl-ACP methyl ester carboxylesterase